MTINFNGIPIAIRTPGQFIEFDSTRAVQGTPAMPHRILVLGQRLSTGATPAGVPLRVLSAAQAETAFGRGSMLATMLAALKAVNGYTECWAIASDDNPAGAAATGTITFNGVPTAAGTLNLYIGGRRVQIGVVAAMTVGDMATALATTINLATSLPVTAAAVAGVVTLTARHKGEAGAVDLRTNYYTGDVYPAGLGLAIAPMGGGAGNPDIAPALAAMGDTQYHTVVMPYTDAANLTKLETELDTRFGPMVQKEGQAFTALAGTQASMSTFGNGRNSKYLTCMAAGKSPTPPYVWAAVTAAVDAAEPDPARPRQTLPLPGVLPALEADRLTRAERNLLLYDGVSTTTVDAGGVVLIERLITMYQVNGAGVDDPSFLDLETLRTLAWLRMSVRTRIALRYPRHKLADDGTQYGAGQAIVTPKLIRAELLALFREWEDAGLAEDFAQFKRDLLVQRNVNDPNRIDAVIPPNTVNAFRLLAAQIQFLL